MAIPKDDGSAVPALPADAGPHERTLHQVFGFSSALVRDTAEDWRQTADGVEGLSRDVAWVVKALQGADEPWSGPAAEHAYASLTALSASLDEHAEMMRNIKKSLDVAAQAADVARSDYRGKVATVSTDVDRSGYTRTETPDGPVTSPAQERTVFDQQGYDQAVADRRQEREQAAKTALDTFTSSMGGAAKTMPVDAPFDPVTIDPGTGGGSGTPPAGGPSGGSPGTTAYQPPSGSGSTWTPSGTWVPTAQDPGYDPVDEPTPPTGTTTTPSSWSPSPGVQGPSWSGGGAELDGSTTGTTAPTTGGSATWAGTSPAGSPGTTSGGVGAGAAGAGGLLGGGAMLLGRGALGRGAAFGLPGGAAGRPGSVVAGSTGAGARGTSATGARGAGGAGRPVVAPGGQGTGRGGRGAGSGVRGARSGGRYGVPKLGRGGAGGSGRGVVAGTGAGGRGRKERDDAVDVEALTHEDEETWFEGEDEAGPPVWR